MEKQYTDFYATIKLKNTEEIFSMVSPSNEGDKTFLMLLDPVTIDEIVIRGQACYKIDPWLKTSSSDMILLNMEDVLTIVECQDDHTIKMYRSFCRKTKEDNQKYKLSRKMGYLSSVDDTRKYLEKLFKS
ncbi:methylamine utilization [Synechococcus phage S-SCSM1]|jgi:hypothetical protein|uniref:Sm-like RNA-binding protein n=1 Tax=Synechococcus phage S-SCSM1 TaxID=2588487 RepID=A0A6M2ZIS7_9CAUD|nr:methylamine utilization [Synechococcus phage S-SCSM1]QFG06305.1 Sm-like RNA-binding protein [Synechococcus phage S-SCSM1]